MLSRALVVFNLIASVGLSEDPPLFSAAEWISEEMIAETVSDLVADSSSEVCFTRSSANHSTEIKGISLVDSKEHLLTGESLASVCGVSANGVDLPGSTRKLDAVLRPVYAGKSWSEETIRQIKQKVYQYYQNQGRPFVIVTVPPQDKKSGVVQLIVEESKLGKIEVVGNKWTPTKRFLQYFNTKPGEPLYERRISKDMNFTNRNPFRRADLIYSPGTEENTTDLTIEVEDRKPYRFYAGVDNTGVLSTGRQRVFAGFSWDQLFDLDHVIFYQYTTNYNANRFHANTFQYMALLPFEMILNLYGGFSFVHNADVGYPNRTNKGRNIQGSMRWQVPLLPSRFFSQEISFGMDVKNTNNVMEFVDYSTFPASTVNLTQFMVGYQVRWEKGATLMQAGVDLFTSPFEWLPGQSNADFASLRPGAKNRYFYASGFYSLRQPMPHSMTYTLYMRAQYSEATLLPSEQLGLGGYDTIRGYEERQFNADNGLFASSEIHSPSFSLFRSKKPNPDKMYLLLFFDWGFGYDRYPVPTINKGNYLVGIGPGMRYNWGPYFTARFDWGIKLHNQAGFQGGSSMTHFSVSGNY